MAGCPSSAELEDLVAGRAPAPEVAAHIEACAACRAASDEIRRNNVVLAELKTLAVGRRRDGPHRAALEAEATLDAPEGYEVQRLIARGGQGVVYQAIQLATKRTVALKLPLPGNLATSRQRQRFEREIEIIAGLRHPHIVTLYGTELLPGGQTVLVMEYVEGRPLNRRIGKSGLCFSEESRARLFQAGAPNPRSKIREALCAFIKICEAVNYAHQRGILHRDLKPANLMIDRAGEPRILDFGLAKAVGADRIDRPRTDTLAGEFMGTLAYAAPEQVQGEPERIDTRTDVYALGVILHEALTGQLPYPMTGSLADGVRSIVETAPTKPSTHNLWLNDEVDTIVLKALAKDQDRRYQSARDLAQDLERYLAGDPIHAKSESAWYLLRKTARRYKLPLAGAAVFVMVLIAFAVVMSVQAARIAAQRSQLAHTLEVTSVQAGRITQQHNQLAEALIASNLERGRLIGMNGTLPAAEDLLWREFLSVPSPPSAGGVRGGEPAALVSTGARFPTSPAYWALWELYAQLPCLATMSVAEPVMDAARSFSFCSDGKRLLSCIAGESVKVWSIPSGRLSATLSGPSTQFSGMRAIPGGETVVLWNKGGPITFWDVTSGQFRLLPTGPPGNLKSMAFSDDGERVAVGGRNGTVQLHQVASGRLLATWPAHDGPTYDLCLSPAGRILASYGEDDLIIRLWDEASSNARQEWKQNARPDSFCFSPDGRTLAFIESDKDEIVLWNIEARQERERVAGHRGQVHSFAYSPDGQRIAAGGLNGVLRIFDLALHGWVSTYAGHAGDITSIRFSPDGRLLATSALDGRIRLWELPPYACPGGIRGPRDRVLSLCFSPSGQVLAYTGGTEGTVQLWNVTSGQSERILDKIHAPATVIAFHPSGNLLASGSQDGMVKLWHLPSGDLRESFRADPFRVASLAFSPEGKLLASIGSDPSVKLWDVTAEVRLLTLLDGHTEEISAVVFSPDGRTLASAGQDNTARLWDASSGKSRVLQGHQGPVRCIQFSPDGRLLATSGDDQTLRRWDSTGRWLNTLTGHTGQVWTVCFSPDGRLMASGDQVGNIRLWDAASGRFLAALTAPGGVYSLSFSPDGGTLAAGCGQPSPILLWDLSYYDRHIAGNLEYQLERVGIDALDPDRVVRLRAWAADVLARPWPSGGLILPQTRNGSEEE